MPVALVESAALGSETPPPEALSTKPVESSMLNSPVALSSSNVALVSGTTSRSPEALAETWV